MARYGYPDPGKDPKTLPETKWEKTKRILKKTAGVFAGKGNGDVNRGEQFRTYLSMIDNLQKSRVDLRGRIALGDLTARAGAAGAPRVTKMSEIMNSYHDKALRLAQAKYYQKQTG